MQYSLAGRSQSADVRTYTFDGKEQGQKSLNITVSVDIGLARRYAISLQELPLLCLHFLEERHPATETSALTFSEREMKTLVDVRDEAKRIAASKRRPPRRPRPNTEEPADHE